MSLPELQSPAESAPAESAPAAEQEAAEAAIAAAVAAESAAQAVEQEAARPGTSVDPEDLVRSQLDRPSPSPEANLTEDPQEPPRSSLGVAGDPPGVSQPVMQWVGNGRNSRWVLGASAMMKSRSFLQLVAGGRG